PPPPAPWTWRCHNCHAAYQLSCTRRCLECNHTFCTSVEDTANSSSSISRKRRSGPCKAEFDYARWQAWGVYRRMTASENQGAAKDGNDEYALWRVREGRWVGVGEGEKARVLARKEKDYLACMHNCWTDCDFPSECRHAVYKACVE
ncbi:hypothetical protein B0H67DRAFT_457439, partial [Lasiosphaeris hirsuta]